MANITPSLSELLATLKRSSLPTILVEGKDDIVIYRHILERIAINQLTLLSCGSRNTLFEIFKRRDELPKHLKFAFIADSDMYIFSNTPSEYEGIIFTTGYSIENDLYASGKRAIDNVLKPIELITKEEILSALAEWFAFERKKVSPFFDFTLRQAKIMAQNETRFTADFLNSCKFVAPTAEDIAEIKADNYRKLRGKYIFQVYTKIFAHFRTAKDTKYADAHIFEMCVGEAMSNQNPHPISKIVAILHRIFD